MAKKEKTQEYAVELLSTPASGAKKTMWRGGRQFEVKVPQILELTDEEVEVYENDKRFKVENPTDISEPEQDEPTSGSESDPQDGDEESSEENDTTENPDSEDSSSDETEENSDEAPESPEVSPELTVKKLVKDNNRDKLNKLALEAGVENPEREDWGKKEVAQAIVDAQAPSGDADGDEEATSNE